MLLVPYTASTSELPDLLSGEEKLFEISKKMKISNLVDRQLPQPVFIHDLLLESAKPFH